jgi:hypothetical protein
MVLILDRGPSSKRHVTSFVAPHLSNGLAHPLIQRQSPGLFGGNMDDAELRAWVK